ncbi:MAG: hypothetical protein ACJAZ2_001921 [Glaciecola sp.]|jgi:hypothetical protein
MKTINTTTICIALATAFTACQKDEEFQEEKNTETTEVAVTTETEGGTTTDSTTTETNETETGVTTTTEVGTTTETETTTTTETTTYTVHETVTAGDNAIAYSTMNHDLNGFNLNKDSYTKRHKIQSTFKGERYGALNIFFKKTPIVDKTYTAVSGLHIFPGYAHPDMFAITLSKPDGGRNHFVLKKTDVKLDAKVDSVNGFITWSTSNVILVEKDSPFTETPMSFNLTIKNVVGNEWKYYE